MILFSSVSVMVLQRFFLCAVLIQCANGRLVEETSVQLIADYFAYKCIHVVTAFTCSRHGTYTSMGSLYRLWFQREIPRLLAMRQNQAKPSVHPLSRIPEGFLFTSSTAPLGPGL
jgi:hypothetical protein